MGKSKGGKYFKPPRSRRPGGVGAGPGEDGEESEEEYAPVQRGLGAQAATAGMLPPSDSEEDGDEDKGDISTPAQAAVDKKKIAPTKPAEDDEEEEDDSDESESSDDAPINEYLSGPPRQKKVQQTEERDPETIRKDLERLQLIRKKREDDRLKRIADEGWDRFAPVTDTNKPPGHGTAPDHPSNQL